MPQGLSLHIGLNSVDPDHYGGWDGPLIACEFDAKDMAELAKAKGFKTKTLLTEKATAKAVKTAIEQAATSLAASDIFFLTISCHGGQVDDLNADEGKHGDLKDRKDETWCLYDREIIDDELASLWAKFKKNVRIIVLSDSCHSGSVTRLRPAESNDRNRLMPPRIAYEVYQKNKPLYDAIQFSLKGTEEEEIKARVLLISGCMDNQTSADGDRNGLFTETLKLVLNEGFKGGYQKLRDTIASKMPSNQTPVYFAIGTPNPAFETQQPFTVDKAKSVKANVKRSKRIAKSKPIDTVLAALSDMGYTDPNSGGYPQPGSPIGSWFRRIAKEDEAAAVPKPGRNGIFVAKISDRLGIVISIADLIKGDYPTPQSIADLA